jgi:uncharacterized protein (DUF302 family)
MENTINVSHQIIQLRNNFDDFTKNIERILMRLDPGYANNILQDPKAVERYLATLRGETGLVLFDIQNHGDLLNLYGERKKAKQYVIGNPLIASQMTREDIRASLYAPVRVIVYEGTDKRTYAEYDLPSSLFGQFGNAKILEVAKGLDEKLQNAIKIADL